MIRRDLPSPDSAPERWALISQIDHAHLAGRLAEHWGAEPFGALPARDELLWAVAHHDDGWRSWDQSPGVDPASGIPRSFIEMEIDAAISIWSSSIDAAGKAGPLQGYVVAGHFCALADRAAAWRKADPAWTRAEEFIVGYRAKMDSWLAAWQRAAKGGTPAVASQALSYLQFFDALSLWFCCAEATGPDSVQTPVDLELTLVPRDPRRIGLAPWPLLVERMDLEVSARVVPAARYDSSAELAAVPAQSITLHWELART